ncbi:MAG TPA: EutN/CcmL family microcompartment protein [Pyrinomonadaceae bacterium]
MAALLLFTIHDLRFTIHMFLGKVIGTVWSTKKTPDLEGVRFLIVHPYDLDREPTKNVVVVADRLGAGTGEVVMCAYGKAARSAIGDQDMSIEAAVVGIVDRVDLTDAQSEELRAAAQALARDNGRP